VVQVTDGKDTSPPRNIKVNVIPLTITSVVNTGIHLPNGDMTLIYASNLTFAINAPGRDIEVTTLFKITLSLYRIDIITKRDFYRVY
jgi:hypothetical protein